jgi:PAS domain-containing protein
MDYTYLKELEGTLKEVIKNPEIPDKKFYRALKDLVDLKLNVEEFNSKFDEISEAMTAMAQGNFNQRVDIPIARNLFAFIGTSLNSVIDELEKNVVKIGFLETLLEANPTPALITDPKGVILYGNKAAHELTNYVPKSLIRLIIKNLFAEKAQFGNSNTEATVTNEKVLLTTYNGFEPLEVNLTIQKVIGKGGVIDGYVYLFDKNN